MKRIQIILSVALLTAPVALLTASSALAQAEAGSEPGSYQAPVVEQVEPQDIPSAEAARGDAEAIVPTVGAPSEVEQPPAENPPAVEQPPVQP